MFTLVEGHPNIDAIIFYALASSMLAASGIDPRLTPCKCGISAVRDQASRFNGRKRPSRQPRQQFQSA